MARKNQEFESHMQGMVRAYEIVKEQGVEALGKEIKRRGVLCIPLQFTQGEIDKILGFLVKNFYQIVLAVSCFALEDVYGFKKVRLQRFRKSFEKAFHDSLDLDYIGEKYTTIEGYARYLNDLYDLEIDTNVLAVYEEFRDKRNPQYHVPKVEILVERMREAGYEEAADWLEKKLGQM